MDLQYCPFQFNQNSRILICFSSTTTRQIHNQLPLKVLVKISEGFPFAVQVIWVQKCVDEVYLQHDSWTASQHHYVHMVWQFHIYHYIFYHHHSHHAYFPFWSHVSGGGILEILTVLGNPLNRTCHFLRWFSEVGSSENIVSCDKRYLVLSSSFLQPMLNHVESKWDFLMDYHA